MQALKGKKRSIKRTFSAAKFPNFDFILSMGKRTGRLETCSPQLKVLALQVLPRFHSLGWFSWLKPVGTVCFSVDKFELALTNVAFLRL